MDQDKSVQKLVPAVERAAEILDLVSSSRRFLTVSELSRETNLPKSTVHGLCGTMVQLGLLVRRADQTFVVGPHVLRWSNGFERQTDVATEFALLCDEITVPEHAAASLSVPENADMVFIAARQAVAGNRFAARPGMRFPLVYSASGKAVLSLSPDFEVRRMCAGSFPAPLTDKSVGGVEDLLEELKQGRAEGVFREVGQCIEGVTNVSSPVVNALNKPLAAVMLSAPSELVEGQALHEISAAVLSLAQRLSRRMGADIQI